MIPVVVNMDTERRKLLKEVNGFFPTTYSNLNSPEGNMLKVIIDVCCEFSSVKHINLLVSYSYEKYFNKSLDMRNN